MCVKTSGEMRSVILSHFCGESRLHQEIQEEETISRRKSKRHKAAIWDT